jgi:hypothetical protein
MNGPTRTWNAVVAGQDTPCWPGTRRHEAVRESQPGIAPGTTGLPGGSRAGEAARVGLPRLVISGPELACGL